MDFIAFPSWIDSVLEPLFVWHLEPVVLYFPWLLSKKFYLVSFFYFVILFFTSIFI